MNVRQLSFSGGEISPSLYARVDQQKYASGLRTCRNHVIQRHGGATNRPGLQYIGTTRDSTKKARLLKFVFNNDQTYVLELGDRYMRFIRNRAYVGVGTPAGWVTGTAYKVGDLIGHGGIDMSFGPPGIFTVFGYFYALVDHTASAATEPAIGADWQTVWHRNESSFYEIPTPWLEAELPALQYVQSADVITFVHPSHPPYELQRFDHARWLITRIVFGPKIATPAGLALAGGIAGTIRYWAVTAIAEDTAEESLAALISAVDRVPTSGTPTVITWTPVTGAKEYNVYRSTDGVTYGLIGTAGGAPAVQSDASWVDSNEVVSTSSAGFWSSTGATQVRNDLTMMGGKAYDGQYKHYFRLTLVVSGGTVSFAQGRVRAFYSRDGEARVDAGTFGDIFVSGSGSAGPYALTGTINVPDNGYTLLTLDLVPEVYISSILSGTPIATVTVDTTTPPSDKVEWFSNAPSGTVTFSDANVAVDFTIGPPQQQKLFDSVNRYPSAVTYFQQRLLLAGTNDEPERVWASRSGSFKSFTTSSPIQDDDSLSFTLVGRQVNAIRHMLDVGRLLILTSGGEWVIEGDASGILRPGEINPRMYTPHGVHEHLAPLILDTTTLFVQARGTIVRDFMRDLSEDYRGTDLTIFAAHMFDGFTLADWDYQEIPHSIVWAVRSDGLLLGLTYLRDHAIWAWHRHDTDGTIENVCTVPEGGEDAVYVVVKRTVNGQTVRYVEALRSRFFTDIADAFFVDSGLEYDGRNLTAGNTISMTISGGTTWGSGELLTLTASAVRFIGSDPGNAVHIEDSDGSELRFSISEFVLPTVVRGFPHKTVPVTLRNVPRTTWGLAKDEFGVTHLKGRAVSVLADGFLVANPNRPELTPVTVDTTLGRIVLDRPYVVVKVGIPYVSDLETLDIDTAGSSSTKDKGKLVTKVGVYLENTRGFFAGGQPPTGADLLANLQEYKERSEQTDPSLPPPLLSEHVDVPIEAHWNNHGRIFIRQIDPLPLSVLAVVPQGFIPTG